MPFPKVVPAIPVRVSTLELHIIRSFDKNEATFAFAAQIARSDNTAAIVQGNLAQFVEQEQIQILADLMTVLQQQMTLDMIGVAAQASAAPEPPGGRPSVNGTAEQAHQEAPMRKSADPAK